MQRAARLLAALALAATGTAAVAQPYPSRPVHLVVGFAPGAADEGRAR